MRRACLTLPIALWPAADRRMWDALMAGGGPLDDRGALAHLRETSRAIHGTRYGRWLGWLDRDRPDRLAVPPVERATLGELQAWLDDDLATLAPMSRLSHVTSLLQLLRAVAPERDWRGPSRLLAILRARARHDHGRRKDGRILSSDVLLAAGLRLATTEADAAVRETHARAHRRDGAMLAMLALGRSLEVLPSRLIVRLSPDMTKTGHAWEATVPEVLEPVLRRYVEEVRPRLLARGGHSHDAFWATDRGHPFDVASMRARFVKITGRELGVRVPPHFFRDAAATTLARLSPAHARLIRSLLGHVSFETGERHYNHARGIEAGRDHAAVIETLKRTLPHRR